MLRPDFAKWGQSPAEIYALSVYAPHARSRERFQALYAIGSMHCNATQWAAEFGRKNQTVMEWVHLYNAWGPDVLQYRRTGGRTPLLPSASSSS
jgi:transposase